MLKNSKAIPLRTLAKEFDKGIVVGNRLSDILYSNEDVQHSHRHDYHFFVLQEKGTTHFELDFKKYQIKKPSVIYIAPNQVHKALKAEKVRFYFLAIHNESLKSEYLKLLQDIAPAKPLPLNSKSLSVIIQAFLLCINLFESKEKKLYSSLLKDSCNTLAALIISQYLEKFKLTDKLSRFDSTAKTFKSALEKDFITAKRPADYAKKLNISVSYLNECVKNATGFSVSHHIQQRVVLEAQRLLYHSDKSVKEIAAELGYEDYAYFSRLFTKVTGMTALTFRHKNRD